MPAAAEAVVKRLALVLALSSSIAGCAHSQHPDPAPHHVARDVALTALAIGVFVLAASLAPCDPCNDTFTGPATGSPR